MATGDRNGDTAAYDAYCAAGERDDRDDEDEAPIRTITAPGLRSCGHAHHPHAPVGTRVACHDCAAEAREEAREESRTREKR